MALVLANRVQEQATANTTVSFTLTGAASGFQTFAVVGNGNTTYYSATDASGNWEVGLGTYSTTGPTLTRTTVYASSNSGSAVTFSGTVTVFVTYPSGQAVNLDASGNVSALGTVSSGTWQGSTVGVAYGGTGVTSSSGANSVVLRDANQNISVNSITQARAIVTSAGGTTTLTAASAHFQILIGTSTQTFQLPDATLLPTGSSWIFDNDSTGNLTVVDNASGAVDVVPPGGYATVFLENNSTVAGTWGRFGMIPGEINWGTNSLDLGGTTVLSNGYWQGNTVQPAYGGTGITTFVGANNALYSTSSSALTAGTLPVAAGGTGSTSLPANNVLLGNGTSALQAVAPGTAGNILTSNGTTWTSAAPSASGTVTSVAMTVPTGLSISGSPITTSGTLALSLQSGYSIPTTASQGEWNSAYTNTLKWSGGATGLDAALGRTSLGLGSAATMTGPSGDIVGTTDTQTLTNKSITPRVYIGFAPSGSQTPDSDSYDIITYAFVGGALTINAPTMSPATDGRKLIFRIYDNGTAQTISWASGFGGYKAIGVTLPTSTLGSSKQIYVGVMYNALGPTGPVWDVIAVTNE